MASILFVCLGNICRSPAAEGILRHLAKDDPFHESLHVESCGIGDWHIGHLPDARMCVAAKNRGVTLASRAQLFDPAFFERFDYILVADKSVLKELYAFAKTAEHKSKVHLMTHYSLTFHDQDVPDPYYNGEAGFEHVLTMLEDSCAGLLEHIKKAS